MKLQHSTAHTLTYTLISGVRKGDRVSIYLPMIPELVYAMLACARIGAVHSIVVSSSGDDERHVSAVVTASDLFILALLNIT